MPRFVLLRHQCPASYKASHWDFMIEHNGVLLSWSLAALPRSWAAVLGVDGGGAADAVAATRLANHRLAYLDYEGQVSNDRGEVCRCDRGEYCGVASGNSPLRLELCGAAIKAPVLLTCIDGDEWQLEATPRGQPRA